MSRRCISTMSLWESHWDALNETIPMLFSLWRHVQLGYLYIQHDSTFSLSGGANCISFFKLFLARWFMYVCNWRVFRWVKVRSFRCQSCLLYIGNLCSDILRSSFPTFWRHVCHKSFNTKIQASKLHHLTEYRYHVVPFHYIMSSLVLFQHTSYKVSVYWSTIHFKNLNTISFGI